MCIRDRIPVPVPPETLDDPSDDSDLNAEEQNKDQEFQCEEDEKSPQLFTLRIE